MANSNPNAKGGPYKGLGKPPTIGPRTINGAPKGGKGPIGGSKV